MDGGDGRPAPRAPRLAELATAQAGTLASEPRSTDEAEPGGDTLPSGSPLAESHRGGEVPHGGEHDDGADLGHTVGHNLRRLRTRRGLSLDRLAKASGVSRAMLGQIELGRSVPTINLLWKIARALDVPFTALMRSGASVGTTVLRASHSKVLASHDGRFTSRALFPFDGERRVEFYELGLAVGASEHADAHAPGTTEMLVVHQGTVEITTGGESHRLRQGDSIQFEGDVPHIYRNVGEAEATMYLVMTYADPVG